MDVGIVTRYHTHEATFAALRIADWFAARNDQVRIFATADRPSKVSRRWDRAVTFNHREFTNWGGTCELLIWTHMPIPDQIKWANRKRIHTALVPSWHEVYREHGRTLRQARTVLAPSTVVTETLRARCRLENCHSLHWDAGLPILHKHGLQHSEQIQFLIAGLHANIDGLFRVVDIAEYVLRYHPAAAFSLLYVPSQIRPRERRRLATLSSVYRGRFRSIPYLGPHQLPNLLMGHDVMAWPDTSTNFGHLPLLSLTCGVPVCGFAGPVIDEYLNIENSVLVPSLCMASELGAVSVQANYNGLTNALMALASSPDEVLRMQAETAKNLSMRRRAFNDCLAAVALQAEQRTP